MANVNRARGVFIAAPNITAGSMRYNVASGITMTYVISEPLLVTSSKEIGSLQVQEW
jgi:hypothetical protein